MIFYVTLILAVYLGMVTLLGGYLMVIRAGGSRVSTSIEATHCTSGQAAQLFRS